MALFSFSKQLLIAWSKGKSTNLKTNVKLCDFSMNSIFNENINRIIILNVVVSPVTALSYTPVVSRHFSVTGQGPLQISAQYVIIIIITYNVTIHTLNEILCRTEEILSSFKQDTPSAVEMSLTSVCWHLPYTSEFYLL